MAALLLWFDLNWFTFFQSFGIVGSLYLTASALRRDTRARKASDLLSLLEQHRELWSELHRAPQLARILNPEVDLLSQPISTAEEQFINLAIVHFHTGWMLTSSASTISPEAVEADVRSFFMLPLPQAVWERTKAARDGAFVRFVEACLEKG